MIVYGIFDPDTNECRYVGQSREGLKRVNYHFYSSVYRRRDSNFYRWMSKKMEEGKRPVAKILRHCDTVNELHTYEILFCEAYRKLRHDVLNMKGPGFYGKHSEETKRKISERMIQFWENRRL